ncbi:MAG: hypothetical protein ACREXS_06885 [Gammaproteobacteria bacterium]
MHILRLIYEHGVVMRDHGSVTGRFEAFNHHSSPLIGAPAAEVLEPIHLKTAPRKLIDVEDIHFMLYVLKVLFKRQQTPNVACKGLVETYEQDLLLGVSVMQADGKKAKGLASTWRPAKYSIFGALGGKLSTQLRIDASFDLFESLAVANAWAEWWCRSKQRLKSVNERGA